jgi:hypothetical protein
VINVSRTLIVTGYIPPVEDSREHRLEIERYRRMFAAKVACEQAGVEVPAEVVSYIDMMDYERADWSSHDVMWDDNLKTVISNVRMGYDGECGCDVDIGKLSEMLPGVKILRVRVSL